MTSKYLVILLGCVVVLVWKSVVVAEECPEGDSNGNCSLTTQYNNEVEGSTTQAITSHTTKTVETTNVIESLETTQTAETTTQELMTETSDPVTSPTSLNMLAEDLTDNDITPTAVPSVIPLNPTEIENAVDAPKERTETASTVSSLTHEEKERTEPPSTDAIVMNITKERMENSSTVSSVTNEEKESLENASPTTTSSTAIMDEAKEATETSVTIPAVVDAAKDKMETTTNAAFASDDKESTEISSTVSAVAYEMNERMEASTDFAVIHELQERTETSTDVHVKDEAEEKTETPSTDVAIHDEAKEKTENSSTDTSVMHEVNASMETPTTVAAVIDEVKESMETSSTVAATTNELKESRDDMTTAANVVSETVTSTVDEQDEKADSTTIVATTIAAVENEVRGRTETSTTVGSAADEPKGRALNFSVEEEDPNNVILSNSSHHNDFDLSDVTINDNDDDFDMDVEKAKILAPKYQLHNSTLGICEKGGLTYENGEKLEVGCDSICTCRNGKMDCTDRCASPFFRRGKKIEDPLCSAKEADDPCCSVLVCTGDTETEPLEICTHDNKTYNRGDKFNKECSEVCTCEAAGRITCKPRCLPVAKTSDRCVEVPDPNDPCCKKVLCDVTLDDHDSEKEDEKPRPKLLLARFINTTAIQLTFDSKFEENENLPDVEVSNDQNNWTYYRLLPGDLVFVKDNFKYLKLENTDDVVEIQDTELGPFPSIEVNDDTFKDCQYKGKTFKIGEEFNDDCESLCICLNGQMKCLKIQCPTYFGVDVLDPNCIEWETVPPNFVPSPPKCCPDKVRCKENGSCDYEGIMYKNWDELPSNVTGCDKKCYCEMGKVECQNVCPPVTALPPENLPCPPQLAMLSHVQGDTCCKDWVCNTETSSPETKHTQTESDSKGQIHKTTTDTYEVPFAPKAPSKVLGPLAVYANEENDQNIANNSLGIIHKAKINPYENPFYHKSPLPPKPDINKASSAKDPLPTYAEPFPPITYNKPDINKASPAKDPLPTYAEPFHPFNYNKPTKGSQNKNSNKNFPLFITLPPPTKQNQQENYIPNDIKSHLSYLTTQQTPTKSEINIHSHSNPEEILQFIHQHPEISNYPSGSVLEFHNLPPSQHQKPPLTNQVLPTDNPSKIHLVPYVVPQNSEGQHVTENLPPGLSLEEILAEFQKNSQSFQNNPLQFLPHPQMVGNIGPPLGTRPSGPIVPNRHNTTYHTDTSGQMFPGNYPGFPNQPLQDEIIIQSLEAVDPHTIRLSFTVPPIIVGLHGRVEVRYTHDKADDDVDSWLLTVFAPPNDLIATPSLVFDLMDLKADTEYKIKIFVTLRDLQNMPSSKIYKISTPKEVHPPVIPINPDLAITDINATWVTVVWRPFTQYELSFIDGLQLRYKEIDGRIYTATPLIHRAETRYTLEKLKPNTKYEIGIYFIPFPGQMTELRSENILHFTTANEIDTYGFNVTLEVTQVKSQSVEISWNGVPYPEDKYVNIYGVFYQSDTGKEDQSNFKIAKRDSPTKTIIKDLKPGTKYRIWLEVYLTNGKIKTSNVEDFFTKPRVAPALGTSTQKDKLSRAEVIESKGDYYGPLVIVAILAAIAILSTLILLLILVRRHNQNKAAITPPSTRISQSAYDNPTYKVEIQQETMGL